MEEALRNDPNPLTANKPADSKAHPIVRLDYPVRVASYLLNFVIMTSVLWRDQPPLWVWSWLGAAGFLWPHLAYLIASRSRDTKAAELRNLLGDNLLVGSFAALSGFSLWPSAMMLTAITTATLSVSGPAFAVRGAVVFVIGALLMTRITGLAFTPDASLFTSAITAAGIFVYSAMFGIYSNIEARRALRARRKVQTQNLHIEEQRQQLQASRDLGEAERAAADQARALAEAANRAKSAFLANMSHELRTPLNAIIGYAEMLEEDAVDTAQRADLQKIHSSGKHLLGLINNVLDLSKIEAGKVELHVDVFDVEQLIDEAVSTVRPLLDKNANRFELRLAAPLGVMTSDATRLRQVLLNLLSNAAKFTHQGEVILAVRREPGEHGGWLCFEVMDSGIGMSQEQLSRLFQPFVQAESNTTRLYGGTGLGLVISRRLCRVMGGDVTVDSEAGHGTRFLARLPALAPRRDGRPEEAGDPTKAPSASLAHAATNRLRPDAAHAEEPWRELPDRIISQSLTSPAVFRLSPEGRITNLNLAASRLFGYGSPAHMLSAVSDVGVHLFARPGAWPEYRKRLLNEAVVVAFEFEASRADGSLMWLSQDACAVRDEKGKIVRFECFAKDITELKQMCLTLSRRLSEAVETRPRAGPEAQQSSDFELTLHATPLAPGASVPPAGLHAEP